MCLYEDKSVICEVLENRTMMSAAPIVHAPAHSHAPSKPVVVPKAATAPKAKLPALLANPALSDPGVSYTSFAGDPLFSTDGPSANDIYQGDLGDCYFLSTLSAVAKVDPALIRKDIINNNDGTYTVDFNKGSGIKPIRVSADLPTDSDGQLAYAGLGSGNSVWVAIFEKAFADFRTAAKSYASLSGGWMAEVFSDLGIKSQSTFAAASATALGALIAKDLNANDAATFATDNTIQDGAPLITDHAYEIDSVILDSGNNPVAVRMRNPWGVDGAGNDGDNDGYVTLTLQQAYENMSGMVVAKV